jgi:hypothetical protein
VNYTELVTEIQNYTQNYESTFVATIPTFVTQAEERIYNSVQIPPLRKNVTGLTTANNKYLSCPSDFLSVFSMAVFSYAFTTATGNSGAFTIVVNTVTGIVEGQTVTGTGIGAGAVVVSIVGSTVTLSVANTAAIAGNVTFQGDYEYLLNKDVNFLRAAYSNPNDQGIPKYYALFGPTVTSNVITDELSFILAPTPDNTYTAELHYYYYPESITVAPDGRTWLGDNYSPVLLYGSLVEAYTYMKGEQDIMAFYQQKYTEAVAQLNRLGTGLERGDAYRDGQAKIKVNP